MNAIFAKYNEKGYPRYVSPECKWPERICIQTKIHVMSQEFESICKYNRWKGVFTYLNMRQ